MKRKHTLFPALFVCIAIFPLIGCNSSPSQGNATPTLSVKEPAIYFPSHFYWQEDARRWQIPLPLTGQNPGPTFQGKNLRHQFGFGSPLQASDLYSAAMTSGQQVLQDETNQMIALGWQPLFQPTATGTFPVYVLYETFRLDSFYCFVEYTASGLDQTQSSQTLDMYYS
jgi:hypothetical protein